MAACVPSRRITIFRRDRAIGQPETYRLTAAASSRLTCILDDANKACASSSVKHKSSAPTSCIGTAASIPATGQERASRSKQLFSSRAAIRFDKKVLTWMFSTRKRSSNTNTTACLSVYRFSVRSVRNTLKACGLSGKPSSFIFSAKAGWCRVKAADTLSQKREGLLSRAVKLYQTVRYSDRAR